MKLASIFLFIVMASACARNDSAYHLASGPTGEDPDPDFDRGPVPPTDNPVEFTVNAGDRITPPDTRNVDILFVVDNSGSMDPYIRNVITNVSRFTAGLRTQALNFQIGALRCNDPFDPQLVGPTPVVTAAEANADQLVSNNLEVLRRQSRSGYELPLGMLIRGLNHGPNSSLFRANAAQVFVILTDTEDPSDQEADREAARYQGTLNTWAGTRPWRMITIGNPDISEPCSTLEDRWRQNVLRALTNLSGGRMARICDQDYSRVIDSALISIQSVFREISLQPYMSNGMKIDPASFVVQINSQNIPNDPQSGFQFIESRLVIAFPGQVFPRPGDVVSINFSANVE